MGIQRICLACGWYEEPKAHSKEIQMAKLAGSGFWAGIKTVRYILGATIIGIGKTLSAIGAVGVVIGVATWWTGMGAIYAGISYVLRALGWFISAIGDLVFPGPSIRITCCPSCGSEDLVPTGSRAGQQIAHELGIQIPTNQREEIQWWKKALFAVGGFLFAIIIVGFGVYKIIDTKKSTVVQDAVKEQNPKKPILTDKNQQKQKSMIKSEKQKSDAVKSLNGSNKIAVDSNGDIDKQSNTTEQSETIQENWQIEKNDLKQEIYGTYIVESNMGWGGILVLNEMGNSYYSSNAGDIRETGRAVINKNNWSGIIYWNSGARLDFSSRGHGEMSAVWIMKDYNNYRCTMRKK